MKNYQELSGLDFSISDSKLSYTKTDFSPAIDWVKDFEFAKYAYKFQGLDAGPTYFGVRYMEKTTDQELLIANDYEYDVTAFESGQIGKEYVKTVGHYHSHVPGLTVSYPEVYEVIDGKIEYILQSEPDADGRVDVILVQAETGDKIVMPPNYGHISLNPTDEIVVESNIQKRDLPKTSDYSLFKDKTGGAIYRTINGIEKNPNYQIRSLRIVRPLEKPEWGLTKSQTLYDSMIKAPEKLRWLTDPANYVFALDQLFVDIEL